MRGYRKTRPWRMPIGCLLILPILFSGPVAAQPDAAGQLQPTQGTPIPGRLIDVQESSLRWFPENADEPIEIPLEGVAQVVWRAMQEASPGLRIRLEDGSEFWATEVRMTIAEIRWTDRWEQVQLIPRERVRSILPALPVNHPSPAGRLAPIDSHAGESDALIVWRDNQWSRIEGRAGELTEDRLSFSIGDQSADIPLERIGALVLGRPGPGKQAVARRPRIWTVDGQQFSLARLTGAENARITTPAGISLEIPWSQLAKLEVQTVRSVWLSDLAPTTNDWQPLMASSEVVPELRSWHLARPGTGFNGQPLRLVRRDAWDQPSVEEFQHGWSLEGGGKLAFRLNGQYRKLTGLIGFAPQAHPSGLVEVRIEQDGKITWQQRLTHSQMREPVTVELDTSATQRLVIAVDYADGRTVGDQLYLVDWKLTE